jgi:hypothetical protein
LGRIADISWPKKILAVSSIYIVGLLTVGWRPQEAFLTN